jgi:hypothetical protein
MKKIFTLIVALLSIVGLSNDAYAIKIIIKKCNKCGVVKHVEIGDWYSKDVCRGSGAADCHIGIIAPGGGGDLTIDLTEHINNSDPIERKLLEQVQERINSGQRNGRIIYNQPNLTIQEVNSISARAQQMLQLSETNPSALESMADKHHFAIWKIEADDSITIIVD